MKSALIAGISGQDGSYMAEYLLSLGYRVTGTLRKSPHVVPWLVPLVNKIEFLYADMQDAMSIEAAINKAWPDEVYNFAAYDGIPLCWQHPEQCMDVVYGGLSRLMNILKRVKSDTRVYQASSAAMFGQAEGPCDEQTTRRPDSPYAIAKAAAHDLAVLHRRLGAHISCGICMNHESPRRSTDRASSKIAAAVARWATGGEEPLMFGSQDSMRDWGYAGDYIKSFHLMLQQDVSDDYVIGTGRAASVREFMVACCRAAGFSQVPDHKIIVDERFVRKNDVRALVANPTKAATVLGWRSETSMEELAGIMVTAEIAKISAARPSVVSA